MDYQKKYSFLEQKNFYITSLRKGLGLGFRFIVGAIYEGT